MTEGNKGRDKDFKNSSAEIIADLLSDPRLRQGLKYLGGDEFKTERERIQQVASERIRNIRNRYRTRSRKRDPETAARERDLSLRLAEVEAESAELRLRLAELLEEEGRLRSDLESL